MKSLFRKILLMTVLGCAVTGCDDNDSDLSEMVVLVSPTEPVTLNSGEKALYTVSVMTTNESVETLTIKSFSPQHGLEVQEERQIGAKQEKNITFTYTAPEINSDTTKVTLTFEAIDNTGRSVSVKRMVTVVSKAVALAEKTGIVLFDPVLGLPDALSLSDVSRPFNLADSPVPEDADIYIDSTTDFDDVTWRSNTRAKFVRYNSFNYSSATAQDIASVFRTSVPTDKVADIQVNDIILVGHGEKAEGVFQVVNILRGQSAARCMQLSYKGIMYQSTDNEEPTEPETPAPSEE